MRAKDSRSLHRASRQPGLLFLSALAGLLLVLAACGGSGGTPEGAGAGSDPCLTGCTIVADQASVLVGGAGGSIDFTPTDGSGASLHLVVPPGALSGPTTLTIVPTSFFPQNLHVLPGSVFSFGPAALVLAAPLTLTIQYDPGAVGALHESVLGLQAVVSGAWAEAPSTLDTGSRTVSGPMTALGVWGVLDGPVPPDNVIYVDAEAGGADDGSSWSDAFTTVQAAMAVATAGQQVWVATGTYLPASANATVMPLPDGVSAYGGFVGDEISLADRPVPPLPTVLSGDFNGDDTSDRTVNRTDNSVHVIDATAALNSLLLDGFMVMDGTAGAANGGGLFAQPADLTFGQAATLTLRNMTFSGNTAAGGSGGGVYNNYNLVQGSTAATITNCTFSGNQGNQGGGLAVSGFTVFAAITNSTFNDNGVTGSGGGVAISASDDAFVRLTNATFSGNTAASFGGAMYVISFSDATVVVANSIMQDNEAGSLGGGIVVIGEGGGAALTLVGTAMSGNIGGSWPDTYVGSVFASDIYPAGYPCTAPITFVAGPNGELCLDPANSCSTYMGVDPLSDAAFTAAGLDWRAMTTDINGTLDTSPVDPGRHYFP
jgi:predicted outer membrane repeat protein